MFLVTWLYNPRARHCGLDPHPRHHLIQKPYDPKWLLLLLVSMWVVKQQRSLDRNLTWLYIAGNQRFFPDLFYLA